MHPPFFCKRNVSLQSLDLSTVSGKMNRIRLFKTDRFFFRGSYRVTAISNQEVSI